MQRIADEYNASHNVGAGLSIHTVTHMFELAKMYELGVDYEKSTKDPYIIDTGSMTAYFESCFINYFSRL